MRRLAPCGLGGDRGAELRHGAPDFGFTEAEAACREVIRLDPNHVRARKNLAFILTSLGRLDEAEAEYRHILRLCPNDAECRSKFAEFLEYRKQNKAKSHDFEDNAQDALERDLAKGDPEAIELATGMARRELDNARKALGRPPLCSLFPELF